MRTDLCPDPFFVRSASLRCNKSLTVLGTQSATLPLINCSYRDYAHIWQRSVGREEGLQDRLSHLVCSCVHRAAPGKKSAACVIADHRYRRRSHVPPLGVGDSKRFPCVASQSSSVRSVVVLSLHQNGLSIGPSAVFGTYGSARGADTGLNIRSISPHRKSNLI
jgi:hypothetical protein